MTIRQGTFFALSSSYPLTNIFRGTGSGASLYSSAFGQKFQRKDILLLSFARITFNSQIQVLPAGASWQVTFRQGCQISDVPPNNPYSPSAFRSYHCSSHSTLSSPVSPVAPLSGTKPCLNRRVGRRGGVFKSPAELPIVLALSNLSLVDSLLLAPRCRPRVHTAILVCHDSRRGTSFEKDRDKKET
jgi:hypothetical protein